MASRTIGLDDTLSGVNYNTAYPAAQGPGPEREWNMILDEMKWINFNAYSVDEIRENRGHFYNFAVKIQQYVERNYPYLPPIEPDKYRHYAGSIIIRQQSNPVWATIVGVGAEVFSWGGKGHASFVDIEADFAGVLGLSPKDAILYGFLNEQAFYEFADQDAPTPTTASYDAVKPVVQYIDEDPAQPQEDKDAIDDLINRTMANQRAILGLSELTFLPFTARLVDSATGIAMRIGSMFNNGDYQIFLAAPGVTRNDGDGFYTKDPSGSFNIGDPVVYTITWPYQEGIWLGYDDLGNTTPVQCTIQAGSKTFTVYPFAADELPQLWDIGVDVKVAFGDPI